MKSVTTTLLVALSVATTVTAHGYVQSMSIGGQQYAGFLPFTDNYAGPNTKITRRIPDDGPVMDFTSTNITCNAGAEDPEWRTNQTAPVPAGSDMSFTWNRWPTDHLGPITTWMANCGDSCTDFDGTGSVWFKIDQLGLVSGDTDTGVWASSLLIANNLTWTVTIPAGLPSGNYIVRQELLALHSAHAPQFYPSCAQVVVSGGGSSTPAPSEMVAIPGYYTNDTSTTGIDIWTNGQTSYPIAGPPVTTLQAYQGTNAKNLNGTSVTAPAATDDSGSSSATATAYAPAPTDSTTSPDDSTGNDSGSSDGSAAGSDNTSGADNASSNTSTTPSKSCRVKKRANKNKRHVAAAQKRRLESIH